MAISEHWRFNGKITLFFVVFFPLMISLGFWQLDREEQKQQLLEQQQRQRQQSPVPVVQVDWSRGGALAFLPVRASGRYDNDHSFLLDNRVRDGQVGYEVLTPFDTGQRTLLVNRGWIPLGGTRQQLPDVPVSPGEVLIRGSVHVPEGEPLLLSDVRDPLGDRWPRRIQSVDIEAVEQALDRSVVLPYVVRLASQAPGALRADWAVDTIQPATHRGYAVQWFAMSAALLVLFLYSSFHRKERQ